MKKAQIKKSVSALAMAAVIAVSLFGYGCGSKPASTAGGVSGDFIGTAKGMGGDVTVTLTLEDGKITGCTAEGKDETQGIGTLALEQLPAQIAETGSIAVDGVSTATITSNAIKEAAAAALTAAGLNADDYKIEVKADETKAEDSTVDADVVIVGAGGAGMTAAITAAAEGKSVVIVESQAMVGGNSVRATGGMNAGKTVYQDENEFGESAGVEKTLKTAAEKYADNETITALAKTVSEQWAEYQKNPTGYFDSVERRIVTHEHFYLKEEFNLMGIHLNARNPKEPHDYYGHISCSCHSVEEVKNRKHFYDYVFMSPIYDSISKVNYYSTYTAEELREAQRAKIIDSKVMALGGINEDNLLEIKDFGFGGAVVLGDLWNRFDACQDQNYLAVIEHFKKLKKLSD